MTNAAPLSPEEAELIDSLVNYYVSNLKEFESQKEILKQVIESPSLEPLIHSVKARVKDPSHLKDKLVRKLTDFKKIGQPFPYTQDNLFLKLNDLVGLRILHLHTTQFKDIDSKLREVLQDRSYEVIEGPTAHTWDDEYKQYFATNGVTTKSTDRMYTSVHYVVSSGKKNTKTAEIQVRTLAEELWGEVDHSMNYPHATTIISISEQIKVLARLTSSCTRLVDCIYKVRNGN